MGVQNFCGVWYHNCINKSGVNFILSVILYSFYFLTICTNFQFSLHLHHQHIKPQPTEYTTPSVREGMKKHTTAFSPDHQKMAIRQRWHTLLMPTSPPTTAPPEMHPPLRPTTFNKYPSHPGSGNHFLGTESEWHQQCIFLFIIIIIYFLFPHPWRKKKQVEMAGVVLPADSVWLPKVYMEGGFETDTIIKRSTNDIPLSL